MKNKKNIILIYFQLKKTLSYFIKKVIRSTNDAYNIYHLKFFQYNILLLSRDIKD